jgi:hypothetical protein
VVDLKDNVSHGFRNLQTLKYIYNLESSVSSFFLFACFEEKCFVSQQEELNFQQCFLTEVRFQNRKLGFSTGFLQFLKDQNFLNKEKWKKLVL